VAKARKETVVLCPRGTTRTESAGYACTRPAANAARPARARAAAARTACAARGNRRVAGNQPAVRDRPICVPCPARRSWAIDSTHAACCSGRIARAKSTSAPTPACCSRATAAACCRGSVRRAGSGVAVATCGPGSVRRAGDASGRRRGPVRQGSQLTGVEGTSRSQRSDQTDTKRRERFHGQYLTAATKPVAPPTTGATVTGRPSK
jgi:hypothetical protein